jgi:dGTPase
MSNPQKLPTLYKGVLEKEGLNRAVCDYIAGMSDNFAIKFYEELVIPKSWSVI